MTIEQEHNEEGNELVAKVLDVLLGREIGVSLHVLTELLGILIVGSAEDENEALNYINKLHESLISSINSIPEEEFGFILNEIEDDPSNDVKN